MLRRDYILRMIEEFIQVLSRLRSLKQEQSWQALGETLEEQFRKLAGDGPAAIARLTETELLARLVLEGPSQAVREKTLMLIALLQEAGAAADAQGRADEARACFLQGLHLLLGALAQSEAWELPAFVPRVEAFLAALGEAALPLETQARLMRHYESIGQFGKAEDRLFSLLEAEPGNDALLDFGLTFYRRLQGQSDASLEGGNLPRAELEAGLAELGLRRNGRRGGASAPV